MQLLSLCVVSIVAEVFAFGWISIKARSSGDSAKGIISRYLPHGAAFILSGIAVSTRHPYLLAAALVLNILVIAYLLLYGRALSRPGQDKEINVL